MTEQRAGQEPHRSSRFRTISLGAAILAVPVGAAWLYTALQESSNQRDRQIEQGAKYDLSALRKVDPALIRFHEVSKVLHTVKSPTAVAFDSHGQLLIGGENGVSVLSASGQRMREIALDAPATCIAATPDGRLLVGLRDHIEVFAADGNRTAVWPAFAGNSILTGIAVSGADVYVADSGRRVVLRCTLDGTVEAELGKADPSRSIPGLVAPSPHIQVAVGADGLIWVSNPGRHRMESYNRDGELMRYFGSPGTGIEHFLGCCNPSHFALLSDGRIVTAEKGVPRVKVYRPDGRLDAVVAGPDSFGDNNAGLPLAAAADGRVLVVEPGRQDVRVFAPGL